MNLSHRAANILPSPKRPPSARGALDEDGDKALLKAGNSGDLSTVQTLLKTVDVNVTDSHNKTCLMIAAESGLLPHLHFLTYTGHLAIVKQLVSKKAKLGEKDSQGWTALHYAAVEGHLDIVMYLVKKGHDPNARSDFHTQSSHVLRNADRTACLHYLVRLECNEKLKKTINLLLKHGNVISPQVLTRQAHK